MHRNNYFKLVYVFLITLMLFLGNTLFSQVRREMFTLGNEYLIVEILDDDLVHFEASDNNQGASASNPIYTSPIVDKTNYTGPSSYIKNGYIMETNDMRIVVNSSTLDVTVYDKTKLPELKLSAFTLNSNGLGISKESFTHAYGLGQKFYDPGNMDGDWVGRDRNTGIYGHIMEWNDETQGMFGNTQFPILFLTGSGKNSYGLFLDNKYKQTWYLSGGDFSVDCSGEWIRWYVMTGPDLKDVRSDYMELTGRPTIPPKKAFGLWVSEYGYNDWNEIDSDLETLKSNNFPVDGFVLDLYWFGGRYNLGNLNFVSNHTCPATGLTFNFSNPITKMSNYMNNEGIGIVAIEESYINTTYQSTEYNDMKNRNYLVTKNGNTLTLNNSYWGNIAMIDWTDPTGAMYWHNLKRKPNIIDSGVIGHWTDLGEPEMYDNSAGYDGIIGDYLSFTDHASVHNLYNLLWNKSMFDGYYNNTIPANNVNKRLWILARAGSSGSQRYGVGMWSADVASRMSVIQAQMNAQMHMSMSGIDYYGSDIGGFKRHSSDGDFTARYTQWFANGCLLDVPIRTHVDDGQEYETSPAECGNKQANLENLRERYEMTPYYYSLAHEAYLYGKAIIPPLVYHFQSDNTVREMGSQKMIGESLMAAIIADYNATTMNVYLPAGEWYNYRTNSYYNSIGQYINSIPLYTNAKFKLPLYARSGAIIPQMYVDMKTADLLGKRRDGTTHNELIIKVFADDQQSYFTLYEDDGVDVDYKSGEVRTTAISQIQSGNIVTVTIAASSGTYDNATNSRNNIVKLITNNLSAASSVTLNGNSLIKYTTQNSFDSAASGWFDAGNNLVLAKSDILNVIISKTFIFNFDPNQPPSTPTGITAAAGNAQVSISWNASLGASGYNLYWTNNESEPTLSSNKISVTSISYVHTGLTNGTLYKYKVSATNVYAESELSTAASAMPNAVAKYEAENANLSSGASINTNHSGYSGTGFVDGYWNQGATTIFNVNVSSAGVYDVTLRYANAMGNTRSISVYVNGADVLQTSLQSLANWDTWSNKTESLALNAGNNTITYKYDSSDNGNINLDYIYVIPGTPIPPSTPTGITAAAGNAQVSISWNASLGASGYNLYWTNNGSEPTLSSNKISVTSISYVHTGLTNGTLYKYKVSATNVYAESGLSTAASAMPNASNDLVVHFLEWESAEVYYLHAWGGLSGDHEMQYEGYYTYFGSTGHWWTITLQNAPNDFRFTFTNSNDNWEGGSQFDRHFTNQAREIWVKHHDSNIYY